MGALLYALPFRAFLGGRVLDMENDQTFVGAVIAGQDEWVGMRVRFETDSLGNWGGWLDRMGYDSTSLVKFKFSAAGYLDDST